MPGTAVNYRAGILTQPYPLPSWHQLPKVGTLGWKAPGEGSAPHGDWRKARAGPDTCFPHTLMEEETDLSPAF